LSNKHYLHTENVNYGYDLGAGLAGLGLARLELCFFPLSWPEFGPLKG
jgi:hypothetical protein